MSVRFVSELTSFQREQLKSMDPSFPLEDIDHFALFEIEDRIYSAAAFIAEDDCTYECYAFTLPSKRKQGFFSMLLDVAVDELPEDTEFIFYTNGQDPDTLAT